MGEAHVPVGVQIGLDTLATVEPLTSVSLLPFSHCVLLAKSSRAGQRFCRRQDAFYLYLTASYREEATGMLLSCWAKKFFPSEKKELIPTGRKTATNLR